MNAILATLSICTYLASTLLIIRDAQHNKKQRTPLYLAWLAVAAHISYVAANFQQNNGFNFSFISTATLVSLIVALLLLMATLNKPVEKLGIVIFPIAAIMLALDLNLPEKEHLLQHTGNWQMNVHILASIIAFSLLNIAALQAILLAIQDQQLKSHPPKRFIQSLPSLQAMEALLFQMLGTGLFFLTLSLISGFIFIEDLFAQHLAHKTVLSIIAWIIFSSLLIGRLRYGWRGRTAVRWTLTGFVLLLLAYFGSKLVLEIILQR
ncbi:MAG: cytochrome c biogenesis protein CcsA [Methylobacter sp.]|nr:cytochrome c biogenesis protein CcsA [Methylobacter sp.]MDP2428977.1 cytochrome c biogenesis protein CcsA [Methylobacter sp.]MDP3055261.1 cytochrome c biogenesis protein CcsA [Methylobacter sp.]MDP3361289.1 cytochrome c biogenesis protein CcsA [Methylobacter sp.]MDZ4219264.1 cytochrome c biogenesis protein CcsA [Methylobacter sp.]